jgi:hypothetical protein
LDGFNIVQTIVTTMAGMLLMTPLLVERNHMNGTAGDGNDNRSRRW